MGTSGWEYITAYREDQAVVLDRLREEVFARGTCYWSDDLVRPASLAQLDHDNPQ